MFIALIAVVVLTIGGVALMRTMAPVATIAGNMAFKQATTQASDIGVEMAYKQLTAIVDAKLTHRNVQPSYHALLNGSDVNGMPTVGEPAVSVDWNHASRLCYNEKRAVTDCSDESTYRIQYLIDRQCDRTDALTAPQTETEILKYCLLGQAGNDSGPRRSDRSYFPGARPVIYRVTVNVRGPRNTSSVIQASFEF